MGCSLSSGKPCVLVLGGPCCGKTTQCAKIAKDFGYSHLSAAELVRNEMNKGTDIGKKCDHLIQDGEPMPLQLVLGVLKQAINKDVNSKGFLIDGFPRSNGQAKELISAFEKKIGRPKMVFFLDCPRDVMEKRAVKRAEEGGTGAPAEDVNKKVALAFEADEAENIPIVNFYEKINPEMVKRVSIATSVPPQKFWHSFPHQEILLYFVVAHFLECFAFCQIGVLLWGEGILSYEPTSHSSHKTS